MSLPLRRRLGVTWGAIESPRSARCSNLCLHVFASRMARDTGFMYAAGFTIAEARVADRWQTWRILHERAFREMSCRYEDGRSMLRHYKGLDRPEEAG